MPVQIETSVVSAEEESDNHQQGATREKKPAGFASATRQRAGDLLQTRLRKEKIDAAEFGDAHHNDYKSAEIGGNTGPSNKLPRAVSQFNVINKKHADGQQRSSHQKPDCQSAFSCRSETNPGLKQREDEGNVSEINNVRVGVTLGAAIFEHFPDCAETRKSMLNIVGGNGI